MSDPLPSGTVVVLREAPRLELLLLRRRPRDGKRGPWVFPGGKVEADDARGARDDAEAARRAAVRECAEEAGLRLAPQGLVEISRWITPPVSPRRFDTFFFATRVEPDAPVRVDGEEMDEHRWITPADSLRAHHESEVKLAPPTFVTVTWLAEFARVEDALSALPARRPAPFHPRIHRTGAGACILYPGDAGYEAGEIECSGPRHRLWMQDAWRYERNGL